MPCVIATAGMASPTSLQPRPGGFQIIGATLQRKSRAMSVIKKRLFSQTAAALLVFDSTAAKRQATVHDTDVSDDQADVPAAR